MFWMIVIIIIAVVIIGWIVSRVIWGVDKATVENVDEQAQAGEFPSPADEEARRERSERL